MINRTIAHNLLFRALQGSTCYTEYRVVWNIKTSELPNYKASANVAARTWDAGAVLGKICCASSLWSPLGSYLGGISSFNFYGS